MITFANFLKLFNFGFSVVEEEESGTVGNNVDARVKALNSIGDNADRLRGDEFQDVGDDGSLTPFDIPEDSENDDGNETDQLENVEVEETGAKAPDLHAAKYKVKVNGQEQELSLEELISRAQKVESADQYLAEASRIYREATGGAQKVLEVPEKDNLALARAIQMGSEEEAVAAIQKIREANLSTDDLTKTIDERLNFQEAVRKFQTEYNDVLSDPMLARLAMEKDQQLLLNGDKRSYYERYKSIGEELRGWVVEITNAHSPKAATLKPPSEKADRKAQAPAAPKAATGKTQAPVEEEDNESPSDVIAKMARARGGPQWLSEGR